jgi:hypothetical protein
VSLVHRLLSAQISLAAGNFGDGGNSLTLTGKRMSARLQGAGGAAQWGCELAIFGMSRSEMNQLSTVGTQVNEIYLNNKITLQAGDAESGMSTIFQGIITYAFVDAQAMPGGAFRVSAISIGGIAAKPIPPTSIQGAGDAFTMLKNLASQAGLTFQSSGASVKLANPYYPGTIWSQIRKICEHCNFYADVNRGTLFVCPQGSTRPGGPTLIAPPPHGQMIGYPQFSQGVVFVRTLFNPNVELLGTVEIQSSLTPACGVWQVQSINYELDTITPHGKWDQVMGCYKLGQVGQTG